jgi:peptide/nickel transport system permease protein
MARLSRPPALLLGAALTTTIVGVALLSLLWTPFDPTALDIAHRLGAPSAAHWLGTDQLGRDVLSQLMRGAGNSIVVALGAVLVGAGVGIPLGLLAAMRGGWPSEAVLRLGDLAFAFPALLTAAMLAAVRGPGALNAVLAIGIFTLPVFARLTRAATLSVLAHDFIAAARLAGRGAVAIATTHLLPNIAPTLIVQLTIQFALAVLIDAGLSYVGLGTPPPAPSWGRMLAEAQTLMFLAPRLAILPGLAIALTVLALNLLGDGLRDWLDPRLTEKR